LGGGGGSVPGQVEMRVKLGLDFMATFGRAQPLQHQRAGFVRDLVRERERERERQRDRETERQRDREIKREKGSEIGEERKRAREPVGAIRRIQMNTHPPPYTHTHTHTHTHRCRSWQRQHA
jgi:hypothetical protein